MQSAPRSSLARAAACLGDIGRAFAVRHQRLWVSKSLIYPLYHTQVKRCHSEAFGSETGEAVGRQTPSHTCMSGSTAERALAVRYQRL